VVTDPSDRSVAAALDDLVADGTLTEEQAARVAARLRAAAPGERAESAPRTRLAEVAGYLGAALLLGAAALFLGTEWDDLGENGRVAVLATVAIVLLVVGGALAATAQGSLAALRRAVDSARRRVVSATWTVAAAAAGMAAGLVADSSEVVVGAVAAVVVAAVTYAAVPGLVGQVGLLAGTVVLVTAVVETVGDDSESAAAYALAHAGLGVAWVAAGAAGLLISREAALASGLALVLFGGQLPVLSDEAEPLGYAITAALAVGGFAGFLVLRSWSVLVAGVVATTLVVPEALYDWTDGSLSAAGSMLVAGVTLLAASAAGLRLRRET
jgi:hypothetical protein